MTISFWQADGQQPVREVDFLIIGAGLAGCSAAIFAKNKGRDVVITDQRDIAMGASGRNAGFMITGLDTYYHRATGTYGSETAYEMWNLSLETIQFWKEIGARHNVPIDPIGSMLLAESEKEALDLEQAAKALLADGIEIIYHDTDPLKRGYLAAIEQPNDAAVQPYVLSQALFRESGAELVANNEVYRIVQDAPDVVTVYTRQVIFKAQYVLLCTNAYSPLLDPYFEGKVIPTRAQVLVTEPLEKPILNTCGYSNYGYMYYRMTFDGRFLLGGGRHQHLETENNTYEDRTTQALQDDLDAYMQRFFPDANRPVARRWSGIMGFSVDGLPLVGIVPEKPRVGFAVGFTGHGLAMAAGTTKRAVDKLLYERHAGAVDVDRLSS